MDETLQLCVFHFKVVNKYSMFIQYLFTFVFILDVVLGYIFMLYHLNSGIVHIYFLSFVVLGFIFFQYLHKSVKVKKILHNWIAKFFRR